MRAGVIAFCVHVIIDTIIIKFNSFFIVVSIQRL